jgi:hypothetical protein
MPASRRLLPAALLAALLVLLALAGTAGAVTKNGITPLAPKAGTSVPAGKSSTFRMRAKGPGQVWVHVCKSKAKDGDGVICNKEAIGRARKNKKGIFEYKQKVFGFPEYWLNSPGTYYWQAHRIDCAGDVSDCRQEGPTVRFKVS